MQTILKRIEEKVGIALQEAFGKELSDQNDLLRPEVAASKQEQFGNYQCNNSLKLAGPLNKSPRDIAKEIISFLSDGMFQKIEVAGPGFINFALSPSFLAKEIEGVLHDAHFGVPYPKVKQRIVIDFSQPNIAKELHVGHLRSTIIGDAIASLFEFLGHTVLRLNHIGDWGTQFGMLIAYLKENEPEVLTGKKKVGLTELMDWYRKSKKKFDEDSDFKKRAQAQVVLLQGGDEASLEAWQMICDISRRGFEEIYRLLDVKLIERGESFYNPFLPEVVADLEKRGVAVLSQGAKCVFLDGYVTREGDPLPLIIQKSDGGYNYATTDLAAMRHRIEIEKADRIIIVTDAGQKL
ncbi:MAG TPA: arginine--tRNA ligase, partial [Rhabdochlamydiaceae bacterium]|nr:arginine--tRNA ligase [Rhabdochlamydiaceae bacterium]